MQQIPLIVVVGVCASGKTTLTAGLKRLGYNVRSFAQEHSVSGRLWQRLEPDFLIVLNCAYETIRQRKLISWGMKRYERQQALLANAREHADLIVETDGFSPDQLINTVQARLVELGIERCYSER
ncbi:MAG: hypothetical protein GX971_01555 [Firmicutes bacterium]|nr:hypothetical protein [Bacillota bacterium]